MYRIAILLLFLGLGSCVSVTVEKFDGCEDVKGVRYYRPQLHVWVKKVLPTKQNPGASGVTTETVWLPDMSQEYIIQWKSGWFGSANPKFALSDGWNLTGFESEVDSAGSAVLGSLSELASGVLLTAGAESIKEGLYRVDATGSGRWSLVRVFDEDMPELR